MNKVIVFWLVHKRLNSNNSYSQIGFFRNFRNVKLTSLVVRFQNVITIHYYLRMRQKRKIAKLILNFHCIKFVTKKSI